MQDYTSIDKCRVSKSSNIIPILNLGEQYLTGVFPKEKNEKITKGPLKLVWCPESDLVQLKESYNLDEMYGDNYGYRSGLNSSMVNHLQKKIKSLQKIANLNPTDTVLDIGSNDCTSLKAYDTKDINRIGIDPTGKKFSKYYPDDVKLVPDFFTAEKFFSVSDKKCKIITSIAMFYDLEDPCAFAQNIEESLCDDGVWHFEQSYLPSMLRLNSYDTICHEHLEYYSLSSIKKILEKTNLKIIDVVMNDINGGSFAVTVAKKNNNSAKANLPLVDWLLEQEDRMGLSTIRPYKEFEERVFKHREDLNRLITCLTNDGKKILGYGASTKGNVILQFCGLTSKEIPAIAEINEEKYGRFTPGTNIPIISDKEAMKINPDYFLVLPWHFKDNILRNEQEYIQNGGKFIFPFPEIQII